MRAIRLLAAISLLGCLGTRAFAQNATRWGTPDDPTVKFIIDIETKWALSSCSPQPDLATAIADEFQGVATDGHRYQKAEAIAVDPKHFARGCQIGDVKVRFFGDDLAIAYGGESRIPKGRDARRCQLWTDTWLKRNGQWQIIAGQDTVSPCKQ